ncbi:MAG: hypothetical protein V3S40_00335 [Kiloniellales bacterium]
MRRILTIAAIFTVTLGIAALSAQPSYAGHKGHSRSSDSGFSVTYSFGTGSSGSGYTSRHKTRIYPGIRHGHRYSHRFRHHHQAARHDRLARRHLKPRNKRRHHTGYASAPACHPTKKIVYGHGGRRQLVRGVMCYTAYGKPYILGGSRYVVSYR